MPIRSTPFPPRPPRFGFKEIARILEAFEKNELWYWQTPSLVADAAAALGKKFGSNYAVCTSSGTASLHVAVAASQIKPGFEVLTSPITDAGTVNAILLQNLVPVFADVEPDSANVSLKTIQAAVTPRTRAVLVVHLTGNPVNIQPIAAFCKAQNLTLIEDCAQGLGATMGNAHIGTFGDYGCYSLNDQKHITSGEGGFVLMNAEDQFYRCHNYADKYYDRHKKGVRLDSLAPNYRMSELDGAMTLAQIERLDAIVARRSELGEFLNRELVKIQGIIPQSRLPNTRATYFFYLFRIDPAIVGMPRDEFIKRLGAEGIPARGAYVPVPLYRSPYFANKSFFPGGVWPAEVVSGQQYDYTAVSLPGAELAVATGVSLGLHEGFSDRDVEDYVAAIKKVAGA